MVSVTLPGYPTPLDQRVLDTTTELSEFPFNIDMNSGDVVGMGEYSAFFSCSGKFLALIFAQFLDRLDTADHQEWRKEQLGHCISRARLYQPA